MLRNANTARAVKMGIDACVKQPCDQGVVIECVKGWHRSDFVSRLLDQCARNMRSIHTDKPLFNVQLFVLNECKDLRGAQTMINDAWRWVSEAPFGKPSVPHDTFDIEHMHMYSFAGRESKHAHEQYEEIWNYLHVQVPQALWHTELADPSGIDT